MNIIISGASKGIGMELAIQLADSGHRVLALARNQAKLDELKQQNKTIEVMAVDLAEDNLTGKLNDCIMRWKQIDILINNAGQLINKPFIETSVQEFELQYKSNVITAVNLIQACHSFLIKGSHIVNIASMGGVQGSSKFPGLSAYSTSKGALSVLTECLAAEYKEIGVNVNALALGAVQTEMLATAFPGYEAPLNATQMAEYIADFACTGSRYYNGQVLPVALGNP